METVSHHLLRRTARARALKLNAQHRGVVPAPYRVEKAKRGPWRWRVVR